MEGFQLKVLFKDKTRSITLTLPALIDFLSPLRVKIEAEKKSLLQQDLPISNRICLKVNCDLASALIVLN